MKSYFAKNDKIMDKIINKEENEQVYSLSNLGKRKCSILGNSKTSLSPTLYEMINKDDNIFLGKANRK